ncbi:MAG: glycoside hydrolase [Candidatus Nitrosocosmicus sp.]|nr:glycoside hydrolase [Candidatus Nitrosocosmicus sp.]MDN5866189.1 glycoside hydrolase [Candidatus Nitrosocosmicus sp.]
MKINNRVSLVLSVSVIVAIVLGVTPILLTFKEFSLGQAVAINSTGFMIEKFSSPIVVGSASNESSSHAPAAVVDPKTDVMYVAYVENAGGADSTKRGGIGHGDLFIKTSTDGGKTFSDPVRVNDKAGEVYPDHRVPPALAIGPNGEVNVIWVSTESSPNLMHGKRTIQFAVSTDGAESFSTPVAVTDKNTTSATQEFARSFYGIDVSEDGKIYIGYLESPVLRLENGTLDDDEVRENTIGFVRSVDGGRTFGDFVTIDTNPCPCCNVHVLAGPDNSVFVSWRKVFELDEPVNGASSIRDMVVARSTDGGQTFSKPVKISDDKFYFDGCAHVGAPMAMDSKGNLHIAWYTGKTGSPGIYYAVSSDMGKTFGKPVPIVVDEWVPPSRVSLAVGENDIPWLAYEVPVELASGNIAAPTNATEIDAWRYTEAQALIEVAKVLPGGEVVKTQQQLNQVDGREPVIVLAGDKAAVLWGNINNEVLCSTAIKSAKTDIGLTI